MPSYSDDAKHGTDLPRVLIATADTLGARMAGPAIRARALAQALATAGHPVELVTTAHPCELTDEAVIIRAVEGGSGLRAAVERNDVVIFQGWVFAPHPWIWSTGKPVVVDLYDPLYLEALEQTRSEGDDYWWAATANALGVLKEQLRNADYFLCASDHQRALWLGHLGAEGRVNPATYTADPTLRNLIDLVPFGVPDEPPSRTGPGLRGVVPGIGEDDPVILWGGGIYEWFDPLTLVRAVDHLRAQIPDVRLLFMGVRHPSPAVPDMPIVAETRALVEELGLAEHVLLNERWVPYDDRHNILLDADVAVTTHKHHVETEFAYRTRVLDYIWARRPIVTTSGDVLADLVEREQLGLVVPPGDVEALAEALHRLLTDQELAATASNNIETVAPAMGWSFVAEPLVRYCAEPHRAADLIDPDRAHHMALGDGIRPAGVAGLRYDLGLARRLLTDGGPRELARRVMHRVRRLLSARG